MNEVQRSVDGENENRSLKQAEQNYASVTDQIRELEIEDHKARERIAGYREAVRSEQSALKLRAEERKRLNKRRRVFYNARHQLQMIDEGL